jgi:mono/diheme cytochrome c family protein
MVRALVLLVAGSAFIAPPLADSSRMLHSTRSSPGDLELGGALLGRPSGSTSFIRYADLLKLPQESYTIDDDSNFKGKIEIEGVSLEVLARLFARPQKNPLLVADSYDHYRANYPADYMAAHHPILVLRINGQLREHWPLSEQGGALGPYLISHPLFKPAFRVLSHPDEAQIPYGVTEIDFRDSGVFDAIRPPGDWPDTSPVDQGYRIARQDCFRCHNRGPEGGTVAKRPWARLAADAQVDGNRFRQIIHDPASVTPGAKMPPHGDYDAATLDALTAYFKTFDPRKSQ